jgi:hypothetical protein
MKSTWWWGLGLLVCAAAAAISCTNSLLSGDSGVQRQSIQFVPDVYEVEISDVAVVHSGKLPPVLQVIPSSTLALVGLKPNGVAVYRCSNGEDVARLVMQFANIRKASGTPGEGLELLVHLVAGTDATEECIRLQRDLGFGGSVRLMKPPGEALPLQVTVGNVDAAVLSKLTAPESVAFVEPDYPVQPDAEIGDAKHRY